MYGIFTYIYHIIPLNIAKCRYIPYMDGMGIAILSMSSWKIFLAAEDSRFHEKLCMLLLEGCELEDKDA